MGGMGSVLQRTGWTAVLGWPLGASGQHQPPVPSRLSGLRAGAQLHTLTVGHHFSLPCPAELIGRRVVSFIPLRASEVVGHDEPQGQSCLPLDGKLLLALSRYI